MSSKNCWALTFFYKIYSFLKKPLKNNAESITIKNTIQGVPKKTGFWKKFFRKIFLKKFFSFGESGYSKREYHFSKKNFFKKFFQNPVFFGTPCTDKKKIIQLMLHFVKNVQIVIKLCMHKKENKL